MAYALYNRILSTARKWEAILEDDTITRIKVEFTDKVGVSHKVEERAVSCRADREIFFREEYLNIIQAAARHPILKDCTVTVSVRH